ncbi:hypothetical protein [Gracilibacillus kekensis]|uniref:Sporulation and spore germination n=1 Tax=Gracilibacillus kekensis TaxID=1027249 RepID=A0A1M7PRV7_9BACI|nr:hypothetical protein [Gracilibacillus kekensis]SHN20084.1 hypothetical protein SAMN05216179_2465 [Gracilibacillus kekensis]
MVKFKNNEEHLKKQLQKMPKVADGRSKDEVYQLIKNKLNHSENIAIKKRRNKWIPTIASACAIVILFIIVLSQENFSNQFDQSSSNKEDTAMDSAEMENFDQSNEATVTGENSDQTLNDLDDNETVEEESISALDQTYNYLLNRKLVDSVVRTAFVTEQAQYIVPLTLTNTADKDYSTNIDLLNTHINLQKNGLYDIGISDMEFETEDNIVHVRFKDSFQLESSGSNVSNFEKVLSFMFRPLEIRNVNFEDNHPIVEQIGGNTDNYSLPDISQIPYKYFQMENNTMKWLVAITNNQYKTLSSALKEMKENEANNQVSASIPTDANLKVEDMSEDHVFISVSSSQIANNQLTVFMIEAILATANSYGYQQVTFDIGVEQVGRYDLTKPLKTTNQINVIDFNK